jgi:hypothetical protein
MSKFGQYDDERSNYNFSFGDGDGKHISVSFRAEPDYDLNIVFNEFKNFLIASGHDVDGEIGELAVDGYHEEDDDDSYPQSWGKEADDILVESIDAMKQHQSADKFSMESFPNNGWPFGDLTTPSSPRLTTTDFASLTPNQFPTMAPLTQEQVQSWTLSSMDIQALTSADLSRWTVPSPGTIGGAKVSFPIPGPHGGGGIYK